MDTDIFVLFYDILLCNAGSHMLSTYKMVDCASKYTLLCSAFLLYTRKENEKTCETINTFI